MNAGLAAWACLVLWSAWAFALQGAWTHGGPAAAWTPEVGVVLMIGLASRMSPERARVGALVLALVRSALSAEPPVATLVAYLALGEFVAALRRSVDTEELTLRTLLAFFGAGATTAWFGAVHALRSQAPAPWSTGVVEWILPSALSTALLGLALGGWLRRLPGIGPLWRKGVPWGIAAHAR